ncbi:MAG TPA: hypothetical protein VN610_03565 [Bryobacteraceae bacterium]|nr:hypothetical protein [Bryobacteraceae bacterium]
MFRRLAHAAPVRAKTSTIPAPVIALALQARFRSRQDNSFSSRMLAAMRQQFG